MGFTPGVGKISELNDTFLSSPADNQVLTYDAALTKWKNLAPSGGSALTGAKDTAASGNSTLTAGSSAVLNKYTGALTSNRTITLAAAAANSYFELSFIDTIFNGFTITITNGTFSHAFSYPTYTKYVSIAGTWERVL